MRSLERSHREPERRGRDAVTTGTEVNAGVAAPDGIVGLTAAEVADRRQRGQGNDVPSAPTRTIPQILRANLFTRFNALLGSLLAVILVVGPLNDALFGFVLVANALIGILQEWRAKRTLDKLAILSAPKARVLRDGVPAEVNVAEVVLDDVLVLRPGDQVVVDGDVVESQGMEIDESLLTGESDPQHKAPGDTVLSGSFVAAGSGHFVATKVGREAYAVALAEEARRFTLASSELRSGIDRIIKLVSWAMLPTAALLLFSQLRAHDGLSEAIASTVGGVVAMVPEGLVLLTSVAFAASVVRLGRQQVLVQELPAVETLARVDVICLDKTGTITAGDIAFSDLEPLGDEAESTVASALAGLAASDPNPNATLNAIGRAPVVARAAAEGTWDARVAVPFSSARKWSGSEFEEHGTWLLGAPEVLLAATAEGIDGPTRTRVDELARQGRRVVLLARTDQPMAGDEMPAGLAPAALVVLADQVRPDAHETLQYFVAQDVRVKVISGDNPNTVAAVAREAGVPDVGDGFDGADLPDDEAALAEVLEHHHVFGRVKPHQKRAMVKALQSKGHVVAMTGDGVNDVLALKDADIGIAMGSGSSASRAAAQIVLLDGRFATMPSVVAEGRRVINNIERVANLFLTKTAYSMLLALSVGVIGLAFPFLPRHLTLVGSVTIGIPAFFLALAPNKNRARSGFVPRVLRFAMPAGTLAAIVTLSAYGIAHNDTGISLDQARTVATLALVSTGLCILVRLAKPFNAWRKVLVLSMIGLFATILVLPPAREFFALELPPLYLYGVVAALVAAQELVWRSIRGRLFPPNQDGGDARPGLPRRASP